MVPSIHSETRDLLRNGTLSLEDTRSPVLDWAAGHPKRVDVGGRFVGPGAAREANQELPETTKPGNHGSLDSHVFVV